MGVTRIFWDTNLFIYLFEGGAFAPAVKRLRVRMEERGDVLLTSALTLGEIQVLPMRVSPAEAERTAALVRSVAAILPFDEEASRIYAAIRQERAIRPADAIQLACAGAAGVDLFVTNDDRLSNRHVQGVKFITSLERAFF
jgi:predicted nucleic acid-binding protein